MKILKKKKRQQQQQQLQMRGNVYRYIKRGSRRKKKTNKKFQSVRTWLKLNIFVQRRRRRSRSWSRRRTRSWLIQIYWVPISEVMVQFDCSIFFSLIYIYMYIFPNIYIYILILFIYLLICWLDLSFALVGLFLIISEQACVILSLLPSISVPPSSILDVRLSLNGR